MNVLRVTDIYWFIPSSSQVTLAFCIETVSNLIFYPSFRLIIKICIRHCSIIKVFGCVTFINVTFLALYVMVKTNNNKKVTQLTEKEANFSCQKVSLELIHISTLEHCDSPMSTKSVKIVFIEATKQL